MRRLLLRWLIPLIVVGFSFLPLARAQNDNLRFNSGGGQQTQADDTQAPVFSYFVSIVATLLIVFTIARPSRKQL